MHRQYRHKISFRTAAVCLSLILACGSVGVPVYASDAEESLPVESGSEWLYEEIDDEAEEESVPEVNVFTGEPTDEVSVSEEEQTGSEGASIELPVDEYSDPEVEIQNGIEGIIEEPSRDVRSRASKLTLLRNNSTYYYYYTKLTKDQKKIYNALYKVLLYPDSTEKGEPFFISVLPGSSQYIDAYRNAYMALMYDHPEFYFAYQHVNFEGTQYYYYRTPNADGLYQIQYQLVKPYANYYQEVTALNKAVDKFMAGIDLKQSEANIALQIHDKLLSSCSYNYPAATDAPTYARTIYSALVTHDPICAGYAFAFTYLMQQAGQMAIVISGDAGTDERDASPHMWNMVRIGAMWYEVDVTWDDHEPDSSWTQYQAGGALANDKNAMNKTNHYLFMVPTYYINNFKYSQNYRYTIYNGGWFIPMSDSVHIRESADEPPEICSKAPSAYGKYYMQGKNCQKGFTVDILVDDGQIFADSNSRYLTEKDLTILSTNEYYNEKKMILMAIDEILARRNFIFDNQEYNDFYGNYKWYKPKTTDKTAVIETFNKYEKYNYKLIRQYKKDRGY